MARRLRRNLRLLQAYALTSAMAVVFLAAAALRQAPAPRTFDEITVQRLNVVDANGTLRLVMSNKDKMHPGVMEGVVINRPRPVAGLIFFNDVGDEVGGLAFSGEERDGERRATGMLAFDQFKQDQTVAISYSEADGRRSAGLQVWDRSDTPLTPLIVALNEANAIADPAEREKAVAAARAARTAARLRRQECRTICRRLARRRRGQAPAEPQRRGRWRRADRVPGRRREGASATARPVIRGRGRFTATSPVARWGSASALPARVQLDRLRVHCLRPPPSFGSRGKQHA